MIGDHATAKPAAVIDDLIDGETVRHLVVGDIGSGKSWFAGQVAKEARICGVRVIEVGCVEFEADVAFLALSLALAQAGIAAGDHVALDAVFGVGEPQNVLTLGTAVAEVLHEASAHAPLLLVIDDAHWADADSLQVLLFAARRLTVASVGFIFTAVAGMNSRVDRSGLAQIRLDRWADNQVVDRLVSAGFTPAAALAAVPLTAGNPLAVELLIDTAEADQRSGLVPLPPAIAVPSTMASRMDLALDQLTAEQQLALAVAAALPMAETSLFEEVLDRCDLPARARARITDLGVVELEPVVKWESPIVRSAALHLVSPSEIADVHRHVADAASAAGLDDLALRHRAGAGIGTDDDLAKQLEEAGFEACDRGAKLTAAESFRQAALASTTPADRSRRLGLAADQAFGAGNSEQAAPYARAAIEAGEGESWATATVLLGEALLWTEGWAMSDHTLCEGARLVADTLPSHEAVMLTHATIQSVVALDATTASERLARAKAAAERSGNELIQLPIPVIGATVEVIGGGGVAADPVLADAVDLAKAALGYEHPIGSAIAELVGFAAVTREDLTQGIDLLRATNDVGRRTGSVGLAAVTSFLLTDALWRSGQWTQAQVEIGTAIGLARDSGFEFLAECGEGHRAWAFAATGRRAECVRLAERSLARTEALQLRFLSIWGHAAMGLAALTDEDYEAAVEAYDRLDTLWTRGAIRESNLLWWQGDYIEALVLSGRTSRAQEVLSRLQSDADLTQRPHAFADVAKAQALLATDPAERLAYLDDAVDRMRACDAPFDVARCLLARGQLKVAHRDREGGMADLGESRVLFDRLGAHPWSERASASREEAHAAPTGLADVLSEAELRIALVIADGAQNKEAAKQLFVSTKTVEYHLSNIYRKLDIRSRVDLARYVSERI